MLEDFDIGVVRCPYCGDEQDAALAIEHGSPPPEDGDVFLCILCIGLGIFEGGRVRFPTDAELQSTQRDPQVIKARKALMITHQRLGPPYRG